MRKHRQLFLLLVAASTYGLPHNAYSQSPADEALPSDVAQAEAADISDWALAGVVWSDANLARKLAIAARQRTDNETARARLNDVIGHSTRVIAELEKFGWRKVEQRETQADRPSRQSSDSVKTTGTEEIDVPSDREAEIALQKFAPAGSDSPPASGSNPRRTAMPSGERPATPAVVAADPIKRFDTETPAGAEDPGIDDELMSQAAVVDIDQYRVDDYVDETRREALNPADAREDAIEGAIAAAAGRRGMAGGASDRISKREGWTLSATLPYSTDSVYDSDDYDPDVDYMVENRAGVDSVTPRSADRGDLDDDINVDNPAEVITGEDEMAYALSRGRLSKRENDADIRNQERERANGLVRNALTPSKAPTPSNANAAQSEPQRWVPATRMEDFTSGEKPNVADARWVQFRLDANQYRYSMTNPSDLALATRDAIRQLQTSAMIAGRSSTSEQLKEILKPLVRMQASR